jgi:hypothetical protein
MIARGQEYNYRFIDVENVKTRLKFSPVKSQKSVIRRREFSFGESQKAVIVRGNFLPGQSQLNMIKCHSLTYRANNGAKRLA